MSKQLVFKKTWKEFRETGLLWWINTSLHLFGWAIVFEIEEDGEITKVYPARVKFRGFDAESTEESYKVLTKYMADQGQELLLEVNEEN